MAEAKRTYKRSKIPIEERKAVFISWLERGNTIQFSCKQAQLSPAAAYKHKQSDDKFREKWEDAERSGGMVLEDEAWRRALQGVEEPVFYKGEVCGHVKKFSDRLIEFLLKAKFPEKYTERRQVFHDSKVPMEFNIGIEREKDSDKLQADPDTGKVPSLQ